MSFKSLEEIIKKAEDDNKKFWEIIMEDDMQERMVSREETFENMRCMYRTMKKADSCYDAKLSSASGMAGGDGEKFKLYKPKSERLIGKFLPNTIEKAIKMGESNACMKRIVAAPTAGSCGVIPSIYITYEEQNKVDEDKIIEALFVSAGIGEILANNASISGAEGGCQVEIGSASAMAAGGLTYLEGGDNESIVNAAAMAIKNMLGLTCDPVAGLVEVPCIKRNVAGAVNAVVSSQMALAGIKSVVPPDQVIDAMKRIGKLIPTCLKETSKEGLATTPFAEDITKKMKC